MVLPDKILDEMLDDGDSLTKIDTYKLKRGNEPVTQLVSRGADVERNVTGSNPNPLLFISTIL